MKDASFFPLYRLDLLVKIDVFIDVLNNISVFNLILLVHVSVLMLISKSFCYYSSIAVFEIRVGNASGRSFVLDYFSYSGFFMFPYVVECSFNFCEDFF